MQALHTGSSESNSYPWEFTCSTSVGGECVHDAFSGFAGVSSFKKKMYADAHGWQLRLILLFELFTVYT